MPIETASTTLPGMPDASAVVERVAQAKEPVLLVVHGRSGFGKSRVADAVRDVLIGRGVAVHSSVVVSPAPGDAVVIDDAQDLSDEHVATLVDLADRSDISVVVFTEQRRRHPSFQALRGKAIKRDGIVDLPGLDKAQIVELARTRGLTVPPALAGSIGLQTGGSIALIERALSALGAGAASRADAEGIVQQAVRAAVFDKLQTYSVEFLTALLLISLDPSGLTPASGIAADVVESLVDRAASCGVMSSPCTDDALREVLGAHRCGPIMLTLLDHHIGRGVLSLPVAVNLAEAGLVDARLAAFLSAQAGDAEPCEASVLYDCAVRAGAAPDSLAAKRSELACLAGDFVAAQALADRVFEVAGAATDDDVRTAVRVSATVAAERGMLGRSAELYRWLDSSGRIGPDANLASTVFVASGHLALAQSILAGAQPGPPTSASASAQLFATGVIESVTSPAVIALNSLSRAAAMATPSVGHAAPDTPPAITALLAIHTGDLGRAQSVLLRTSTTSIRHQTLLAWTTMLRGELTETHRQVSAIELVAVHQRDLLFVHALRVALARRVGDAGSLVHEWKSAQDVLAEYTVDLFSLLPLGELWLAAVRLGEADRVVHLVDQARTLMADLGEPPAWAAAFHWYGVQAAILAQSPGDLLPHAKMLAVAAKSSQYAAGLALAGRVWLDVLKGNPDATEVETAARHLERIGLSWDGARLASEAALRVSDTKTATSLLQVARSLRPQQVMVDAGRAESTTPESTGSLSERECEVADLLVLGMTYKEIGSRLYISAKTVEHHVSRIRRRVGAGSRSELMSMLRSMGHGSGE